MAGDRAGDRAGERAAGFAGVGGVGAVCPDCGARLPEGTQRYCVRCGAVAVGPPDPVPDLGSLGPGSRDTGSRDTGSPAIDHDDVAPIGTLPAAGRAGVGEAAVGGAGREWGVLPPRDGRRWRRALGALVVIAAVVVAAVSFWPRSHPALVDIGGPMPSPGGSGSGSVAATSSSSAAAGPDDSATFVREMRALVASSTDAWTSAATTAAALTRCGIDARDAASALRASRDGDDALVVRVRPLGTADAPGAAEIVQAFTVMEQAASESAGALADWADDVAAAGCRTTAPHTQNWTIAATYSAQADDAKQTFLGLWNPISASG